MITHRFLALFAVVPLMLWAQPVLGNNFGIINFSGMQGSICNSCHLVGKPAAVAPAVSFDGPATLGLGGTGTFTFTVHSNAPATQIAAGFNVAAGAGTLSTVANQGEKLLSHELTHTGPKNNDANGDATWMFKWKAPAAAGNYTLFGAGNSVNKNTTDVGDASASAVAFVAVGNVTPLPTGTPTLSPTPRSTNTSSPTRTSSATPTDTSVRTPADTPTPTDPPTATALPGDANCDGRVTAADVPALVTLVSSDAPIRCGADASGDKLLDAHDIDVTVAATFEQAAP